MHLYAHVNSIEDGVGLLLVHLVGLLDHLVLVSYLNRYKLHFYHTKNLPLWTKPTPNTLASYWASLSLFIFSSSALTHSLLVAAPSESIVGSDGCAGDPKLAGMMVSSEPALPLCSHSPAGWGQVPPLAALLPLSTSSR